MQRIVEVLNTARRWPRRLGNKGITVFELLIVLTLVALLVGIAIPSFRGLGSQEDAAARRILSDVRLARSRAIAERWEYKVLGFNSDASSAFANQYRLLARSSAVVGWPGETAAPFESPTHMAGQWVNLNIEYPGALVNPGDTDATARFWVAFDARGTRIERDPSFDPLDVSSQDGTRTQSLSVSPTGIVTLE